MNKWLDKIYIFRKKGGNDCKSVDAERIAKADELLIMIAQQKKSMLVYPLPQTNEIFRNGSTPGFRSVYYFLLSLQLPNFASSSNLLTLR